MALDPVVFQRAQISSAAVDWSGAPAIGLGLQDLDPLQIERARQILRSKAPSSGLLELSEIEFLQGLEAVRDGRVTHAGMLLFARREVLARYCPQAQFHYVFHDSETTVARNDIDRMPLLEVVERMEHVFVGPLNPEREIELGLFKLRIPQFPIEGVREAVLNALTHRDYQNPGEILLRHSAKELVVTSPGGFVDGITPDNILRHEAVPRNRTLANALVKLRLVESSGIGRKRIFRSALVYGKRRPEYSTDGFSVTLRIFNQGAHEALAALIARLDAQGADVGLDELLVLDALRSQDFIDVSEAARVLQTSREDARRVLPESYSKADTVHNIGRAALFVAAMAAGRMDLLDEATQDRVHQPQRAALFPPLFDIFTAAKGSGAHAAWLSGAGSSVAAICSGEGVREVAAAMLGALEGAGMTGRTLVTRIAPKGAEVATVELLEA
ncbi:MAG: hypothetical protein HUU14_11610 [Dehalococcoidia bacterium]|nr:hypothetical protein [Dehalococcoidia bacterium]